MVDLTHNVIGMAEETASLGSLKGGDCFRFAHISFADALTESLFYVVIDAPEKDRVMVANPANGERLLRDKEHRVVKHKATFSVHNTEWKQS